MASAGGAGEAELSEDAMAEDGLSVSLIAISFSNHKLGIACYEEISNTMYCDTIPASVEEMEETIVNLKQLLKPTLFLLHPNILSNKSLLELILSGVDGSADAYRYRVLRSAAWKDNACQQLIHNCLVIRGKATGLSSVASGYRYISSILGELLDFFELPMLLVYFLTTVIYRYILLYLILISYPYLTLVLPLYLTS
jgi:hypothetical protein